MSVLIVTSLGDIVVDLYSDKCPLTTKNFLKLCKIKYYNGCLFHTVQKDFTAQTGDPTGIGSGGDSVYKFLYGDQARFFSDEIHIDLKHSKTGTVAMASAGENLNASQFYITLRDNLDYLDGKHTVFGEVAEGLDTLTRINEAYVDESGRPYKNIRIKHTYILDDPFDDPPQLAEFIPDASPEGKPKDEILDEVRLEDDWVPMDEQLDPVELEEVIKSKQAHSRAVVLESIGDIPDAEIKPPDNVLFVCKLNPVTEDEDLHTIFSRFGTVVSAEIIRDHKTGDSLCYAFIEFEDKQACEQAYFKMDNALIDDRRIHVDFSQSVAKLWSQYRRKAQTGKGCFKCGSSDHMAKDCTEDAKNNQTTKYILKEDNAQRGGDDARYEMVFDGDGEESPRQGRGHRRYDKDDPIERKSMHRGHRDQDNRDRYGDRNRGGRYERGARDVDSRADRNDKDKYMDRRRDDDGYGRKDDLDSRKRYEDDSRSERRTGADYRRKTDSSRVERRDDRDKEYGRDREKRKRDGSAEDGHEDRRRMDNRDHRTKQEDRGRQESKNELRERKRNPDDDEDYRRQDSKNESRERKRNADDHEDYKRRREERGQRRKDVEFDDDRHSRHRSDRR